MPMIVIPLGADQPDNARRVEASGAGTMIADPDVPSIQAAVKRVLADVEMRAAAGRIASEIAAMPSIDDAVFEFERLNAR